MRNKSAIQAFQNNFNCCQSVLKAFGQDISLNQPECEAIAAGFGAGMGRMQKTCGAVTGSYMVLGMLSAKKTENNDKLKSITKEKIDRFNALFLEKNPSLVCKQLLEVDLNTDEGNTEFEEKNLIVKVCEKAISDAVRSIEKIEKL